MKTLKELLDGVELPVKVKGLITGSIYRIMYEHDNFYYGHIIESPSSREVAKPVIFVKTVGNFRIYTEPKPKVMRAQYLVYPMLGRPYVTDDLFKDDAEFEADHNMHTLKSYKRLADIECES